jgi:hypothetical protein
MVQDAVKRWHEAEAEAVPSLNRLVPKISHRLLKSSKKYRFIIVQIDFWLEGSCGSTSLSYLVRCYRWSDPIQAWGVILF